MSTAAPKKKDIPVKFHLASGTTVEGVHSTAHTRAVDVMQEIGSMKPMIGIQIKGVKGGVLFVRHTAIEAMGVYMD